MQMRYMNGFLRELSENILNHIKILSDWRTKTIRDYVELSFIGFSRSEVGGFGSTVQSKKYLYLHTNYLTETF